MTRTATALRYAAFTLIALFGLLGGLFLTGETFADPGGWSAVMMTAAWVLPLIALSAYAVRSPRAAGPLFVTLTVVVVLFILADSVLGIVSRGAGPVGAVAVFALAVPLAFVGMHRAKLAGVLLLGAGSALLAATRGHLGGSSGAVALPILVIGLLFLLSAVLDHRSVSPGPRAGRGHPRSDESPRSRGLAHPGR